MGFLDKKLGDLSLDELKRLISSEVSSQIQPLPAGLADLADWQFPLVTPLSANQGMVLGYDRPTDSWKPILISDSTDGVPPGTPLTVTVQPGIDFFAVTWTPVTNADFVTYDVHVSTVHGFTPSPSTLAGSTPGTIMAVRQDPGTSAAFLQATTYYFLVVARDADGSSSASTEQASQLVQANSDDIAANSITASKILAGAITADKLEAFLILASTIATSSAGARVEFDSTGIRLYDSLGNISMSLDAQSGSLQLRGLVNFGRDPANPSRLTQDDLLEFYEQPASFMTPSMVQSKVTTTTHAVSTQTLTWDARTTKGNLLYLKAVVWRASGTPPTISTPTGYTLVQTTLHSGNRLRMSTFKKENAAAAATAVVNLGSAINSGDWFSITGSEWAGVENASTAEDTKTTATASASTTVDSGTTAATTLANELVLADFSWVGAGEVNAYPPNPYGEKARFDDLGPVSITYAREVSSWQTVGATGAQDVSLTTLAAVDSIGHIVTFKARTTSGSPGTPDVDRVRLYARPVSDNAELHVTDEAGTESAVVLGKAGEVWRQELVTVVIDPANLTSDTGQDITVSVSGLAVGDYCFFLGSDAITRNQIFETNPVCTSGGSITLKQYNADPGAVNVGSQNFYFLVIHRS